MISVRILIGETLTSFVASTWMCFIQWLYIAPFLDSVDAFLLKIPASLSHTNAPSNTVARLVWADFPTGLQVAGVDEDECPLWNKVSSTLIHATLQFASFFMADEGWFVCLSLMDQLPKIHKIGRKAGLLMHRVLSLHVESSYIYDNGEQVRLLHSFHDILLNI